MSKKVLIISSSYQKGGNSEQLAESFAKGAREAGYTVEMVYLREKTIGFCRGCVACLKTGHCVFPDDAVEIAAKMHDADVLVFATPVYYYEMAGQMKTLLDRANSLYDSDYAFRDIYLLTASAEEEDSASDGPVHGLNGWIACFERARLAGVVRGGGANDPGEMGQDKLDAAYQMGKSV